MHAVALLSLLPLVLAVPAKRATLAPVLRPRDADLIPDQYIVVLKDGVSTSSIESAISSIPHDVKHVYNAGSFSGFASKMDAKTLAAMREHPDVDYIEQDGIVRINTYVTESSATWGISRISHKASGASSYVYDDSAGAGTCSYVIDTGIYTAHADLEGRATWLANFADDGLDNDGNGHGTHVSGTIGSKTWGVAKKTKLYAVKVLDSNGQGTFSGVIAGMNYVTNDTATRSCPKGAVANMSLGGGFTASVNQAAAAMIAAGVFLAVAAGNSADDAANYSPASEPTVCTVGATDNTDAIAYYSNYGSLVDIFAPGSNITSIWKGSANAQNTISGTSMATPHITGLGAYLLSFNGAQSPQDLCSYIQKTAISNKLTGIPSGTVNALAFNGNPSG